MYIYIYVYIVCIYRTLHTLSRPPFSVPSFRLPTEGQPQAPISLFICIYIYIYRERERDRYSYVYIYIYVYAHLQYTMHCFCYKLLHTIVSITKGVIVA